MNTLSPTRLVDISLINLAEEPDRFRPGDTGIDDLAASISEHGLINPITLIPAATDGRYDLVAGHRRLLAHVALGRLQIESKVLDRVPEAIHALRLTENLQREDLSPIETAVAIKRWRDQEGITQEQAAEKLGRGLSWLKKAESLLSLQDDLMDAVHTGQISASVAVALKSVDDDATRGYYLGTALQYGCTTDVATAWAQNYKKDSIQSPEQLVADAAAAYNSASQEHMLPCHVCQQLHPISILRNVFLCPADFQALAGATRAK